MSGLRPQSSTMRRGKSSATSTLADRLLQVLLQKSRGGSLDGPAVLAALSELNDRDAALARQLEEAAEGQDGPKVTDSKGGEEGIGDGALLLDLAIKANCSASLLRAILDAFPGVSKRPGMRLGSSNSTALHQVIGSSRGPDVVRLFLSALPEQVACRGEHKRLPLHTAAASSCSKEVLAMLLDAYPAAAAMADSRGDLPLHLALGSSCKHLEAKLRFLAQRHPQAIAVKGGKGLKPVALARQFQCSADIVRMLCRLSPQDHRELDAPRSISEACAKAVDGFQSRQKGADERIGLLDRCLRAILSSVTPSEEDAERRLNLQHRLTMAMREGLGQPGLFVIAMGSFACGLYTPSSDMDFSLVGKWTEMRSGKAVAMDVHEKWPLSSKEKLVGLLKCTRKILYNRQIPRGDVQLIPHARVPILKFTDRTSGIDVDISVGGNDTIFKSHAVSHLPLIDSRFWSISMLVKKWAKVNGINDASQGTLSSWLICMMVIFHLQTCTPAVLPAFKALHSDWSTAEGQTGLRPLDSAARATPLALHHALGRAHALAMSMREFGRGQEAGIAQLLGLFFVKVNAAINWWLETDCAEDLRMSVWEATWTTKEWKRTYMIGVEDPFDDSDNCARALNTSMGRIRQAFSQAARLFDSPAGPDARGILHGLFGADVVRRLPPSLVKELEQTAGRQHQKPTGNGTGGRTGSRRKERKTHAANLPGLAQPQTEDLRRLSINSGAKSVPQPTEGT